MRININRKELLGALKVINARAKKNKNLSPFCQSVLLRVVNWDNLELVFSDRDISISIKVPGEIERPGQTGVKVADLWNMISGITTETVCLELEEEQKIKRCVTGREKLIKFMRVNDYRISVFIDNLWENVDLKQYPARFYISQSEIKSVLENVMPASIKNESRRNLSGIHISQRNETARFTATDGHRLSRWETDVDVKGIEIDLSVVDISIFDDGHIVQNSDLDILLKSNVLFNDRVRYGCDDRYFSFSSDNVLIAGKFIEGRFPNCDPIIPKVHDQNTTIDVDKKSLIAALKPVCSLTRDKIKPVKLTFSENEVGITSEISESGQIISSLPASGDSFMNDLPNFHVGLNAKYIIENVKNLKAKTIRFCFKTWGDHSPSMTPALLKSEDVDNWESVLMPLRLDW